MRALDPRFVRVADTLRSTDNPNIRATAQTVAENLANLSGRTLAEALAEYDAPPAPRMTLRQLEPEAELDAAAQTETPPHPAEDSPAEPCNRLAIVDEPTSAATGVTSPGRTSLFLKIEAAIAADPHRGNREIGREIGCSKTSVATVRAALERQNKPE